MREVLLTSSVLILALLGLRRVFRQKISRRVQYALWALVLVRLLVPVSLPALDFSVLTMAEPVQETISARLEAPAFTGPVVSIANLPRQTPGSYPKAEEPAIPGAKPVESQTSAPAKDSGTDAEKQLTLIEILGLVWLAGTAGMTVWLLASNLSFAAGLRGRRKNVDIPGCKYRVYMVESGLTSPCLFGVLRPAIYLTPSAVRSEESLRHVLAHEETHARHLDPLWALLRGVCLAVYWFNPLVWIAAAASKTDCELACDEGAIRRLGEGERLAYGRTLLSLIPVRRLPGNPLLSATTMSSDKKRLRDRVTRIAENRKTRKLALCAMALLTAGACLVTFAGRSEGTAAAKEDGPITAAELRYFNERFFNGDYVNIRNQFLSSTYETPADINLFELAYCGIPSEYNRDSGRPAADQDTILNEVYGGIWPDCATYEISTAALDALLTDTMGLTLAETNQVGLEGFTYLPEYDTYYWAHGDTNYRGQVNIAAGVREGDLVRLYYSDTFYADGWKCVTLREGTDGGYRFVSNVPSEKPVIPTAFPEGEPLAVISLADLTPYEPQAVEMTHHSGDCEERFTYGKNWNVWGRHIQGYRSTDGKIYVAEITESKVVSGEGMVTWEADCFLEMPDEEFYIDLYHDLFGRDGFTLKYTGDVEGAYTAYYAFDEDGTLRLLCTVPGGGVDCQIIDLDGDGVTELLCTDGFSKAALVFQRDGKIYSEDIMELLKEALPEEDIAWAAGIDPYARCLTVRTSLSVKSESGVYFDATPTRNIYFDGENLLVYKQDRTAVDHIVPGVAAPEDVMDAIRTEIQHPMEAQREDYQVNAQVDDWRITGLEGPWHETFYEDGEPLKVEFYRFSYEFHAAAPDKVRRTEDVWLDENGWFTPGHFDGHDYLVFRVEQDGARTYLFRFQEHWNAPGSEQFRAFLEECLYGNKVLRQTPAQEVQAALDEIMSHDEMVLELDRPVGGRMDATSFTVSPGTGNARNRQYYFTDPSAFSWTKERTELPAGDPAPDAEELTFSSMSGSFSLTFFSGNERVLCRNGDSRQWYRAENLEDPADPFYDRSDIFSFMRQVFDEAESSALAKGAVIGDDGRQSREEIARKWAEVYERAQMETIETNRYYCTYVDVRDVEIDEERPQELMPEYPGAADVFLFRYSVVFVPDDYRYHMAGNTEPYTGDDVPEGAYQYWRCGYMYLLEDGWHCDGAGTGP